jgi:hypothetical protein
MAESTLVEKLRQIADAKLGDPMPECLRAQPEPLTHASTDPECVKKRVTS